MYINTPTSISLTKIKENPELINKSDSEKTESKESPIDETSLSYWACKILNTADPKEKCRLTHEVAEKWKTNQITDIGALILYISYFDEVIN